MRRAAGLLLLLAPAAAAQDPVRLEYAFPRLAGRTAVYDVETEQTVSQEVEAKRAVADPDKEPKLSGEARTRVIERQTWRFAAEGEGGRVEVETGRIDVVLEENGKRRSYASDAAHKAPERVRPLLGKSGRKMTLGASRRGEIGAVEGVPEQEKAALRGALLVLPAEPLVPGGGWERVERQPLEGDPPLGTLTWRFRYTLGKVEPGKRRIEVRIDGALEDAKGERRAYDADLRAQEGRGWIVLDDDGLVLESLLESSLEIAIKSATGVTVQRMKNRTRQSLVETK